jgi:pSer/pThr/pTyr-binding forkhead associated (FHA) protein
MRCPCAIWHFELMETIIFAVRLLLTVLLYLFLAAVFVVLWRDLRSGVESPAVIQERKAQLVTLAGCAGLEPSTVLELQAFTTLGRGAANTIVVPDTFASAEHALISWHGGQWWLEDLGSRNGTQINDVLVTAPTVLGAGDVISIGQAKLKFQLSNDKSQISNTESRSHFEI